MRSTLGFSARTRSTMSRVSFGLGRGDDDHEPRVLETGQLEHSGLAASP